MTAKQWLARLTKLNAASGRGACRGKAPHKPLLLLCLLDLAERGELPTRTFARSPELVLRFRSYGSIVIDRWPTRLDIRLPFYHLSSQGFWEPLDVEMRQANSPESCVVCDIAHEFFELLADAGFRLKARMVLITKYFTPNERIALFESIGIQYTETSIATAQDAMAEATETAKRKGRSARFAIQVCSEYRFTCALTGYRCIASDGASIVDAAHIESWAETQNDDLQNGLALSKNAHWMFDQGLWTVDDEMRVTVNVKRFTEHGPELSRLSSFGGRHLQFDPAARLRPSLHCLRKHRVRFGMPFQ